MTAKANLKYLEFHFIITKEHKIDWGFKLYFLALNNSFEDKRYLILLRHVYKCIYTFLLKIINNITEFLRPALKNKLMEKVLIRTFIHFC